MKAKRPYRPKDTNELAKYIMELSTGERQEVYEGKPLATVKSTTKKKSAKVLPKKSQSGHEYIVFEDLPADQQKAWKEVMAYHISSLSLEGSNFTPHYADYDAFYDWWVYGTPVTRGWFKNPNQAF